MTPPDCWNSSDCVEKVSVTKDQLIEATLKPDVEDYSSLPTELVAARFALTLFREEEVNLETAFLQLTQGLVQIATPQRLASLTRITATNCSSIFSPC
ncbi:MAG UNVERIFIED_CONTAM: hypothetical protein LVR18_34505 [Planctomycetaceae bacterium]|jgi:hypothetical protein